MHTHRASSAYLRLLCLAASGIAILGQSGCVVEVEADGAPRDAGSSPPGGRPAIGQLSEPARHLADTGGDRPFDQYTWLTTHNAFTNYEDARWSVANQSRSLRKQLDSGVRALMLDVYRWDPPSWLCFVSLGLDCYAPGIYLCHGGCGDFAGVTYALPRQSLAGAMTTVRDFLRDNPSEVVTVFLESYVTRNQLAESLDRVSGLSELVFDPAAEPWLVKTRGWPTLSSMVAANERLVMFSDTAENEGDGITFDQGYTVQNYWSLGDLGNDLDCRTRWDHIPLDQAENGWNRLFVMNHFRHVPTAITAAADNAYDKLRDRVDQHCLPAVGRLPSYIAVDFFEVPGGAPKRYVDHVNASRRGGSGTE